MNGTELHAAMHVEAYHLADLRAEQETTLAHVAAMRRRLEGALQRAREHTSALPPYIEDMRGVQVQVD
jgi:hypothetical protein